MGKCSTALLTSQIFAVSHMERKGPVSPPGQSWRASQLNMPFSWACVHFAVQGILTNHGEFSSKALVIFIRLGNDAFTHSFWQGFTAEQLPGLVQSWKERSSCAQAEAKLVAFIGKPRGSHHEGRSRQLERVPCFGASPAQFPAVYDPAG